MARELVKKDPQSLLDFGPPIAMGKILHIHSPSELLGTRPTITSRECEIKVYTWGVALTSKKTQRQIVIYDSNIKCVEVGA